MGARGDRGSHFLESRPLRTVARQRACDREMEIFDFFLLTDTNGNSCSKKNKQGEGREK